MAANIECPYCGAIITEIFASYEYSIEQDSETGDWKKGIGDVTYSCSDCLGVLDLDTISDVLSQVDKL